MSYKTIVVQVTESRHLNARVEAAATIAARENAHLIAAGPTGIRKFISEALAVSVDGGAVPLDFSSHIQTLRQRTDSALKQAENIAKQIGVPSFEKQVIDDDEIEALSIHGRYSDLLVLGQPDPDEKTVFVDSDFHEYVVLNSSEAALIIPYSGAYGNVGQQVLIAWNASQQAKRAVYSALPLLQRAKRVLAAIYNPPPVSADLYGSPPGAKLIAYLARHGVDVHVATPATDGRIGDALLSLAANEGSDLLVMGCYSHSRFREMVLGGTTRAVLKSMKVPVLMSH